MKEASPDLQRESMWTSFHFPSRVRRGKGRERERGEFFFLTRPRGLRVSDASTEGMRWFHVRKESQEEEERRRRRTKKTRSVDQVESSDD